MELVLGIDLGTSYFKLAFSPHGASVLEWYQQKYASEFSVAELVAQAEGVQRGCDGLIALSDANTLPGLEGFLNRQPGRGGMD